MMKKFLPVLFLTCFCLIGKAQNVKTSTILWSSIKTMDVNNGNSNDEVTTLTNYGTTRIEWKNADGTLRKTFQIIEVIGEWTNVASNGSLTFEVTNGTNSGTITIRKDDQSTRALMVIVTDPPQVTELTLQNSQVISQ